MRTMLNADEFWAAANFRAKLKSPLEMVVSAVRAVNGDVETATQMVGLMNTLGEPLYRKQEPTGYTNRGGDWLNSASLLARMNFANTLAQGKVAGRQSGPDAIRRRHYSDRTQHSFERCIASLTGRYTGWHRPVSQPQCARRTHGGRADSRLARFSKTVT